MLTHPNGLLIFLWKETHSETKSWKSSRISTEKVTTTVNPGKRRGFCVWSQISSFSFFFHHFLHILHFLSFFHFFHFFICFSFCSFFIFQFFSFFHFSSFFHFISFCVMFFFFFLFFFFLSFSFSLLGAQNLIFFGPPFREMSLNIFLKKKFSARLGEYPSFEASFPFLFLLFFPFFPSFFFSFSFSWILFFFSFVSLKNVFLYFLFSCICIRV